MKTILTSIAIYAILGGIVATLNRLLMYANAPEKITRKEDGKIHWNWMLFDNTIRIMVAVSSAIFVGVVVLHHVTFLDEYSKYAIAGMSAIVGEQIWNVIGRRIKSIVEKWSDTATTETTKSNRRGGR